MALIHLSTIVMFIRGSLLVCADISVNLTPSEGESRCGETISINPGNETTVFASGKVPNGHCSIYFRATKDEKYSCEQFCVTIRSIKFDVCYVKVKFTAVNFEKNADITKSSDCWSSFENVWCPATTKLQMDVLERDHYHYHFDRNEGYNIAVDIHPVCKQVQPTLLKTVASNLSLKTEERQKQIKIEGIVVGVCLAAIFLVVLFVMYLYYKSKATNNIPEENSNKTGGVKLFSNIKSRLINRRKSNVVCIENDTLDSYQRVKQTDDDADHVVESPQPSTSADVTSDKSGQDEKDICNSSV